MELLRSGPRSKRLLNTGTSLVRTHFPRLMKANWMSRLLRRLRTPSRRFENLCQHRNQKRVHNPAVERPCAKKPDHFNDPESLLSPVAYFRLGSVADSPLSAWQAAMGVIARAAVWLLCPSPGHPLLSPDVNHLRPTLAAFHPLPKRKARLPRPGFVRVAAVYSTIRRLPLPLLCFFGSVSVSTPFSYLALAPSRSRSDGSCRLRDTMP